jgi:hypothetical protein
LSLGVNFLLKISSRTELGAKLERPAQHGTAIGTTA